MKKVAVLLSVSMLLLVIWSPGTAAETKEDAFQAANTLEAQLVAVYEKVAPSVVSIATRANAYDAHNGTIRREEGVGSGFVYSREGHVLTCFHVIEGADELSVTLADGRIYKAQVVGVDPVSDLAALAIDTTDELPEPVPLADSSQLRVGQFVVAIGSPFGLGQSLSTGVISALGRVIQSPKDGHVIGEVIQTDAAIHPGSSGGPLLDLQGHLIGVNSQIVGPTQVSIGIGFAVSSNTVRRVAKEIVKDPVAIQKSVVMLTQLYLAGGYAKLEALASVNGIGLKVFDQTTREQFFEELRHGAPGAAIYANANARHEDLLELSVFAQKGGKVLLVYNSLWQEQNESLQELFGVAIATESVKRVPYDQALQLGDMLPSHMSGMEVTAHLSGLEVNTPAHQGTIIGEFSIQAYLNTSVQGGERGHLASEESGLSRLTYLELLSGNVVFWPSLIYAGFPAGSGFHDDCIEDGDNEQAALALLNHLVE